METTAHPRAPVILREQDQQMRALIAQWLDEAGYAAVEHVTDSGARPVLVIADLPEPHAADALVASLREYRVPILVVSARFRLGLGGSAETARRLGVRGVLPKPFTRRELLTAVRTAIGGAE